MHDGEKTGEETFRERNKMKAILTTLVDGVMAVSRDGIVTLANKAAEEIFKARHEGLVGKPFASLVSSQELNQMLEDVFETGRQIFTETALEQCLFRVQMAAINGEKGDVEGAVVVFHDVTDARKFDQMRSEFVANVSHELRTPLTAIKGFVETLLDGALEDKLICRRFLTIIEGENNRLTRLIDDLLTLSAIESRERKLTLKPVCLVTSIIQVMNILGPQAREKRLHLELIFNRDLPPVKADEDLVGQVLINLIDNAIKYTSPGGKIVIRVKRGGDQVFTSITDTGTGIPQESLPRLFERFYRVDKARSRELGGTGLGLAIVKHIVESHGGEVFVESELGKGSTFGFSLWVA
ncbi:MAG: PAS domain-containing protein [Syntrophothermus sp.]|uniref:two-component system histidine kinase PnpS n=1 Tax=Syntrophothermus sp. TaxID=2736299 RepID=UPI00257E859F|nr:ATP-binding protein [Syntrophothermus sp.]NSW82284.1 PAS domain-containing protein [Syntrophothermus sp.]